MKQIEVLGVEIKAYSMRESMRKVDIFLRDGKINTIAYITTRGLMAARDSEPLQQFLSSVDLTVIADSDILRAGGIANRNNIRETDNDEFMHEFLKKLVRLRKKICLLTSTVAQLETLKEGLRSYEEELRIIGSYSLDTLSEQGHDEDYLINEINVAVPHVIISNISSPQRETFFEANHMKLNADIWLMLKDEVVHQKLTRSPLLRLREFMVRKLFARQVSRYQSESAEDKKEEQQPAAGADAENTDKK